MLSFPPNVAFLSYDTGCTLGNCSAFPSARSLSLPMLLFYLYNLGNVLFDLNVRVREDIYELINFINSLRKMVWLD